VKSKPSLGLVVLLLVVLVAWRVARRDRPGPAPAAPPSVAIRPPPRPAPRPPRPAIEISDVDVIDGRVLDAATREGVPDAKLVFRGSGGDATFTTSSDGTFELARRATGELVLATILARGYAPYSPGRAGVHLTLAVRGSPMRRCARSAHRWNPDLHPPLPHRLPDCKLPPPLNAPHHAGRCGDARMGCVAGRTAEQPGRPFTEGSAGSRRRASSWAV